MVGVVAFRAEYLLLIRVEAHAVQRNRQMISAFLAKHNSAGGCNGQIDPLLLFHIII
ncbi:hypothetical protein D3C81_2029770 [compost metagenome]